MSEEMVTVSDNGVWKMDAKTFHPKPEGFLKIGDVEYPIFSFLDIDLDDSITVADLGQRDDQQSYKEIVERGITQILLLNSPGTPRLTRESFKGLAPRQVIMLTVLASSLAKVPLKAAGKESNESSNSPSPSPAAAVSSGGDDQAVTSGV